MFQHQTETAAENRPDDATVAQSRSAEDHKSWSTLLQPDWNDTLPLPFETADTAHGAATIGGDGADVLRGGAGNDTLLDKKASNAASLPDVETDALNSAVHAGPDEARPDGVIIPELRSEKGHNQWVPVAVSGLGDAPIEPHEPVDDFFFF
ncbi:MAG: hypothetical protein AAGL24_05780 [Pseudomonadota bacterium]